MNELIEHENAQPAEFDPLNASVKLAVTDAQIDIATKVKNWSMVVKYVREKVEQIQELVGWWDDNVQGAGGDRQSIVTDTVTMLSAEEAKNQTGFSKKQVSRMRNSLKDVDKYEKKILAAAYAKAFQLSTGEEHASEEKNDWYTPPEYIAAAREVMGDIDLDPASSDIAQKDIQATNYYTKEINGLTEPWEGRIWLNPPYSGEEIKQFIQKLLFHIEKKEVSEAIVLTNNATDTHWFHDVLDTAGIVCLTKGRIGFINQEGEVLQTRQGQTFFYLGASKAKFKEVFSQFGRVLTSDDSK